MATIQESVEKLNEYTLNGNFEGAMALINAERAQFESQLKATGIAQVLKKATKDRVLISFVDASMFGEISLDESLLKLERLVGFQPGALVLNDTWGLGVVKRIDAFYKKITVDFDTKRGHQFSYAAATDMLVLAPEGHVLVIKKSDPGRIETMIKESPAEFVKLVLKSRGEISLGRLEDFCVNNGFIKAGNWKAFWEKARADLKKDKCVEIPVKRTDPIKVKREVEEYGESWRVDFSHETDPKLILAGVREYLARPKADRSEEIIAILQNRLSFAVTAARKVDDALYARLAITIVAEKFDKPSVEEMKSYLWERKRFVKAAANLPSREIGQMFKLLSENDEDCEKLFDAIPEMTFTAVSEMYSVFKDNAKFKEKVGALLCLAKAPATLVTLVAGKYESFESWTELPALISILTHAIALGEGRQSGEVLKMQNVIRRLFADSKWLDKMFDRLNEADKVIFFERFQASIAWEPASHHTIVVRMVKKVPELSRYIVKAEKKREYARITSYRSFAVKKAEYLKLINEDMPANVKRIEFAKSYGDLSENAEYQYAKDEQRALMQKQSLMQQDLDTVKPGDFASASTSEVMPGVGVVVSADGEDKTYWILGEWDNDIELGIISSKARLAVNLMGKKVGETFELPKVDGTVGTGTVKEIVPLTDDIRKWMEIPEGMQI
jgi:transcription elongation GreA/GreB family factor